MQLKQDTYRMFQNVLLVFVLLLVTGVDIASCSECCKTDYNSYEWCSSYCCNDLFYNRCCSYYGSKVSYNYATSSDCDKWFSENVWAAVLIGLGSLGAFVGIIVCCVCCVKGCAGNNNRTGAIIVQPGQQQGQGMMMQQQQQQQPQQQPYPYGVPMHSGQTPYPPGHAGPSNFGLTNPSPYTDPGAEKHSGGPAN